MDRLEAVAPRLISLLEQGRAEEVEVPGFDRHLALIRQMVLRSWIWGEITARDEIARANRGRVATFAEPPPLDWSGPPPNAAIQWLQNREVLLGKWNRDLDAEVTKVLVQSLETGASKAKMMESLAEVFPSFSARRLEMIARTESTAALTQGRLARFRDPDSGVEAVQFVAIMDARTSSICRPRDGLVLRLDDERLVANTPPLHINCRSTLVPILDWSLEALAAGDERLEKRWFGWLKDSDAPKNLQEAMEKWDDVPPPAKGFGRVGEESRKVIAERNNVTPPPEPAGLLKDWVDKQKTSNMDPDDIRKIGRRVIVDARSRAADAFPGLEIDARRALADVAHTERQYNLSKHLVKAAKKLGDADILQEAKDSAKERLKERNEAKKLRKELRKKLTEARRDALIDTLSTVRKFGGIQHRWGKGTAKVVKATTLQASQYLPEEWLQKSRKHSTMNGSVAKRGGYDPVNHSFQISDGEGGLEGVALHELGHRMERVIKDLGKASLAYLAQRTKDEKPQRLKDLTGVNYRASEKAKPDRFLDAYFGKDYDGDATEILSMGLQSVFYGVYNLWDEDPELLEFVIGALATL